MTKTAILKEDLPKQDFFLVEMHSIHVQKNMQPNIEIFLIFYA